MIFDQVFPKYFHISYVSRICQGFNNSTYFTILYVLLYSTSLQIAAAGGHGRRPPLPALPGPGQRAVTVLCAAGPVLRRIGHAAFTVTGLIMIMMITVTDSESASGVTVMVVCRHAGPRPRAGPLTAPQAQWPPRRPRSRASRSSSPCTELDNTMILM